LRPARGDRAQADDRHFWLGPFPSEFQDGKARVDREPKPQGIQFVQEGSNSRYETGTLGINQQSESACQAQSQGLSYSTSNGIIKYSHGIARLQGQHQHFSLPWAHVGDQW